MDLSLETQHKIITLESMSISETLEVLPKRLPGFVANVKSFIGNLLGSDDSALNHFTPNRKLAAKLKQFNYVTLSPVTAYVPAGMKCTYMEYLTVLEKGQAMVDALLEETLKPAMFFVSLLLAEPDRLQRIAGNPEYRKIKFHDREGYKKLISSCMHKSSVSDRSTIGDVLQNMGEWSKVEEKAASLQESQQRIDRGAVVDKVAEITGALDKLLERAEAEPDVYQMSNRSMKDISDLAFQVANEVEFYVVYSFQLQQMLQALTDTQKQLDKIANQAA